MTLFDPHVPGDLARALRDGLDRCRDVAVRDAATATAERFDPDVIAERFALTMADLRA